MRMYSCHVWLECISLFRLCFVFADVCSGHLMEDRPQLAGHTLTAMDHENEQLYNSETPVEAVNISTPNLDAGVTEAAEQLRAGDDDTDIKTGTSRSHRCTEIPSLLPPHLNAPCTGLSSATTEHNRWVFSAEQFPSFSGPKKKKVQFSSSRLVPRPIGAVLLSAHC